MPEENAAQAKLDGYTTKEGLLYLEGRFISLPSADKIANEYGFAHVEGLVKALEALK